MNFIQQEQIVRVVHCKEQLKNYALQWLNWYTDNETKRRVFENELMKLSVTFVPKTEEETNAVTVYGGNLFPKVENNYPKITKLKFYVSNTPLIWRDPDYTMESLKNWDWRMEAFAGRHIDLCPIEGTFQNPTRIRLIATTKDMEEVHEEYKLVKLPPLDGRIHQQFSFILDKRQGVPLDEEEDRDRVNLCHVLNQLLQFDEHFFFEKWILSKI